MSPASTAVPFERTAGLVAVDGRVYPLRGAALSVRAAAGVAASTLTQRYLNPYDEPLEVVYTLPLPADAAVLGYEIRFGERVIRGVVQSREEAAAAYRDALFTGRSAGLLEQDRDDVFRLRLGSLPAHQEAAVEIALAQPLAFLAATDSATAAWEFRFPTVVGVRYAGAPGRSPDRDRWDPDRAAAGEIPARLALELAIEDGAPEAVAPRSPSHAIEVVTAGPSGARVLAQDAPLDRDAVVQWNATLAEAGPALVEGTGLPGDDGRYALLTLTPPAIGAPARARDLVVLIDASGSMAGEPLRWARRVVGALLDSFEPADRFQLLAFASETRALTSGSVLATPRAVAAARQQLDRLTAHGGTEMAEALIAALEPVGGDAQRQVVLVTDGQVGFEREVVGRMLHHLPEPTRVHVVGIGAAPNRTLLRNVARAGRGVELIVSDERGCEATASRLVQATVRPTLSGLCVSGAAVRGVAPARPADVHSGAPIVLTLELDAAGGDVEVRGTTPGTSHQWIWRQHVGARAVAGASDGLPIGALHGRERIADLDVELAARPDRVHEFDALVERVALRHRIVSRRTSLVAIAEEPSVDPTQPRRIERLAVEIPAGVSADGVGITIARMPIARMMGVADAAFHGRVMLEQLAVPTRSLMRSVVVAKRAKQGIVHGELVQIDGPRATFELVSEGDLELPQDRVEVRFGDRTLQARVVPEAGSGPGPHQAGLLVRLVLEVDEGDWPSSPPLALAWATPPRSRRWSLRPSAHREWHALIRPAGALGT